jgi:3-oxoacyl-(acyl-carrier-protein) synthase
LIASVSITALSSISALGSNENEIWKNYKTPEPCFTTRLFNGKSIAVASVSAATLEIISTLRSEDVKYQQLDNSVLYAIAVSRNAVAKAGWKTNVNFGINIGSSRGATQLFEKAHKDFLNFGSVSPLSSPTTTLGNISSWIAHDLQTEGPEISHSITCSTALHALLNGVAWLQAGMSKKFLVGGSEAPLTDFTLAQMNALKIYAKGTIETNEYPCRALDLDKTQNSMVLGEAASVCCLEIGKSSNALAYITGIGYATEILTHNVSISTTAVCFQKSMKMAMANIELSDLDVIVMHAPGTLKGDSSEFLAIQTLFKNHPLPLLTTNKWKVGHTFGASGMLSIEMAVLMLQHNTFIDVPFIKAQKQGKPLKKILVNAVGFGGNAVSILLEI